MISIYVQTEQKQCVEIFSADFNFVWHDLITPLKADIVVFFHEKRKLESILTHMFTVQTCFSFIFCDHSNCSLCFNFTLFISKVIKIFGLFVVYQASLQAFETETISTKYS